MISPKNYHTQRMGSGWIVVSGSTGRAIGYASHPPSSMGVPSSAAHASARQSARTRPSTAR